MDSHFGCPDRLVGSHFQNTNRKKKHENRNEHFQKYTRNISQAVKDCVQLLFRIEELFRSVTQHDTNVIVDISVCKVHFVVTSNLFYRLHLQVHSTFCKVDVKRRTQVRNLLPVCIHVCPGPPGCKTHDHCTLNPLSLLVLFWSNAVGTINRSLEVKMEVEFRNFVFHLLDANGGSF